MWSGEFVEVDEGWHVWGNAVWRWWWRWGFQAAGLGEGCM
tara:strand:- start:545 stop:664 length:120 start_codon:yes stop_codon:yes gene_type:complete